MVSVEGGGKGSAGDHQGPNVTDLLNRLNLTEEEGVVVDFSDDDDDVELPAMEWAIVGKVLSPMVVHVNTVCSAMKPAWGNPVGLKFRAIDEKGANLFAAEFADKKGTPWMVGRHAIIL